MKQNFPAENPYSTESPRSVIARIKIDTSLQGNLGKYSLDELAMLFAIGGALAGMRIAVCGAVASALVSVNSAVIEYSCFALWIYFVLRLWFLFVKVGKVDKEQKVVVRELHGLHAILHLVLFLSFIATVTRTGTKALASLWELAELAMGSQWLFLCFYGIYFLLAVCIRVQPPWITQVLSALTLALAIIQVTLA